MAASTKKADSHEKDNAEDMSENQEESELGSEDLSLLLCDPCDNEGNEVSAEGYCKTCEDYLCGECYRYHCKPKQTRHHVLVDSQTMPKSKQSKTQSDDSQEKCQTHTDMPMKIYCRVHDTFGCISCLSSEHKECTDVSFIQDCAKGVSDSREYSEFQEKLKSLETSLTGGIDAAKSEGDSINELSALDTQQVQEIFELVKNVNMKINEARKGTSQLLNYADTACENAVSEIKDMRSDKHADTVKFMNMKKGQSMVRKVTKCIYKLKADVQTSQEARAQLKTDAKLLQNKHPQGNFEKYLTALADFITCGIKEENKPIGNVKTPCVKIDVEDIYSFVVTGQKHGASDTDSSFEHDYESDPETKCRITGLACLTDGSIALVDFTNNEVKVYQPLDQSFITLLGFEQRPFDIAEITEGRLAVTMPLRKQIFMLTFEGGALAMEHSKSIKTGGVCRGICSNQRILYVTFDSPPKVEIMDVKGTVLYSFSKDSEGELLFTSPWYVAYNQVNSNLYVADRVKSTVTSLTEQGKVSSVFTAGSLKRPYGITVDSSGVVYVCSRWMDRIYCLTPDLDPIQIIHDVSYLKKPESVACSKEADKLYVGLFEDDLLTVLRLKKSEAI